MSARAAADELSRIAARFESKALAASATHARGRVRLAEGDAAGARAGVRRGRAALERGRRTLRDGARAHGARGRVSRGGKGGSSPAGVPGRAVGLRADRSRARGAPERRRPAATRAGSSDRSAAAPANVFRREGDFWSVVFEDRTARLRDLKGLHYLARLLADPGKEFHVVDLVSGERPESPGVPGRRMPASCSMPRPSRPTAGGSPRSRRTSKRRGPWGIRNGPHRRRPNVSSSSASSPVRSGSAVVIDARVPSSERARASVTRARPPGHGTHP